MIALGVLSLLFVAGAFFLPRSLDEFGVQAKAVVLFAAGVWAATLHACYLRWVVARRRAPRPGLPGEGVLLGVMLLTAVALSFTMAPEGQAAPAKDGDKAGGTVADVRDAGERVTRLGEVRELFQPKPSSWIVSPPRSSATAFTSAPSTANSTNPGPCTAWIGRRGPSSTLQRRRQDEERLLGAVRRWRPPLRRRGLSPALRLQALLPERRHAGENLGVPDAQPHRVVAVRRGRQGLFRGRRRRPVLRHADDGKPVWHETKGLHVDANPVLVGGRIYCGSGVGDIYKETCAFCVDAATGKEIWRRPTDLPVWGESAVAGGRRLRPPRQRQLHGERRQAGRRRAVPRRGHGGTVWRRDAADGVQVRVSVDRGCVYFASRDRNCYCLDRTDGRVLWKKDLGGPVVASPGWCAARSAALARHVRRGQRRG